MEHKYSKNPAAVCDSVLIECKHTWCNCCTFQHPVERGRRRREQDNEQAQEMYLLGILFVAVEASGVSDRAEPN